MKRFRARLLEMAQAEILSMIPTSEYMRIKDHDKHPLFRAYIVGHEGESRGDISVDGENFFGIVKKWYKSAIDNLHEKIAYGLKLFHGHDYSGSKIDDRHPIGEVVGKATKKIKELYSEIIVAYIYPSFRNLPLDIASIEADIILSDVGGEYLADVEGVTGIALEHSGNETPGFPGATVLGFCQEFAENKYRSRRRGKMSNFNLDDLTIDDVRTFVKEKKISPGEVFSFGELARDPEIKEVIADAKDNVKSEHERRKRLAKELDESKEEWEKEKGELLGKNKKLLTDNAKGDISDMFEKAKTTRKLDEKEIAFIQKRLTKFDLKEPEKIKEEFDTFLDQQVDDFSDFAIAMGIKKEAGSEDGKGKEKTGGVAPGDETDEPDDVDDDDFIPGDASD